MRQRFNPQSSKPRFEQMQEVFIEGLVRFANELHNLSSELFTGLMIQLWCQLTYLYQEPNRVKCYTRLCRVGLKGIPPISVKSKR